MCSVPLYLCSGLVSSQSRIWRLWGMHRALELIAHLFPYWKDTQTEYKWNLFPKRWWKTAGRWVQNFCIKGPMQVTNSPEGGLGFCADSSHPHCWQIVLWIAVFWERGPDGICFSIYGSWVSEVERCWSFLFVCFLGFLVKFWHYWDIGVLHQFVLIFGEIEFLPEDHK